MVYPKTRMKQSRREPRQPLKYHTLLLSSVVTKPTRSNNGQVNKGGGKTKGKRTMNSCKGPTRQECDRFKLLGTYVADHRWLWSSYCFKTKDGRWCEYCPSYAKERGNTAFIAELDRKGKPDSNNVWFDRGPQHNGRTNINFRGLEEGKDYFITDERMTDEETTKLWGVCGANVLFDRCRIVRTLAQLDTSNWSYSAHF